MRSCLSPTASKRGRSEESRNAEDFWFGVVAQFSRKKRDFTATFARLLAAYTSARFQKKLQAIARHRDVSGIPWRAVHC